MMYPYITLDDGTELVHSEMLADHTVKVYIEKPDENDGFHYASCFLPGYLWEDVSGFSTEEIRSLQTIIQETEHQIAGLSQSVLLEHCLRC